MTHIIMWPTYFASMLLVLCEFVYSSLYSTFDGPILLRFESENPIDKQMVVYRMQLLDNGKIMNLDSKIIDNLTLKYFEEEVTKGSRYCFTKYKLSTYFDLFYFMENPKLLCFVICPERAVKKHIFQLMYNSSSYYHTVHVTNIAITDKYGKQRYIKEIKALIVHAIVTPFVQVKICIRDSNGKIVIPQEADLVFLLGVVPMRTDQDCMLATVNVKKYSGTFKIRFYNTTVQMNYEVKDLMVAFFIPVLFSLILYLSVLLLPQISNMMPQKIKRYINIVYGNQVQKQIFKLQQRMLERQEIATTQRPVFAEPRECDLEYSDDSSETADAGRAQDLFAYTNYYTAAEY